MEYFSKMKFVSDGTIVETSDLKKSEDGVLALEPLIHSIDSGDNYYEVKMRWWIGELDIQRDFYLDVELEEIHNHLGGDAEHAKVHFVGKYFDFKKSSYGREDIYFEPPDDPSEDDPIVFGELMGRTFIFGVRIISKMNPEDVTHPRKYLRC